MQVVAVPPPADVPADLPRGRDLGRVVAFDAVCARYGRERVGAYADAYSEGDELSYSVLRDIHERDGFGWKDFHRALDQGTAALDDPPPSLVALFEQAERVPDWVDHEQLRRAGVAYWRTGAIVPLALTSAIGRGFKNYGGMKPTIFTGRLIDERRVGRRMVETLRYLATVTAPGAMERHADGWKYTLRLRLLHASVRWGCSRSEAWEWENWGVAVNNADSLGAPLEFSVGLVDMLAAAGVELDPREDEDITALWRYIAYVLGTPEHMLMTSAADARVRLAIMDELNHPPDDTNRLMLHSLVDFAAREGIGYDPLPEWLARRLPPARRKALTYGLMYAWSTPDVCEQMQIPRNPYRHILAAMRPAFRARERLAKRSPAADARRCERILRDFAPVTSVAAGESPLANPDEVARDIEDRGQTTAALFGRGA